VVVDDDGGRAIEPMFGMGPPTPSDMIDIQLDCVFAVRVVERERERRKVKGRERERERERKGAERVPSQGTGVSTGWMDGDGWVDGRPFPSITTHSAFER